jgi:hypothetical protein
MIQNFEEVKKQLAELSEVVNKFKSEAVQLRIVELVFAAAKLPVNGDTFDELESPASPKRAKKKRKAAADSANGDKASGAKKKRAAGSGPKALLEQFINDGFFNQTRTIGAVVAHCKLKARNYKANELSGPLGRLVRDNQLSRTTNAESQFEYVKK